MILFACIDPVDVQTFLKDPQVQDVIESLKSAVKVDDQTEEKGLTGAKGRIEGLKEKYYMVEKEVDADGVTVTGYPKYVTEGFDLTPGQLISDLGYITKISGGKIIGLTDLHTYTVRDAAAFPDGAVFYSENNGTPKSISISGGKTSPIPAPTGALTLNLTSVLEAEDEYEIMAINAAKWGSDSIKHKGKDWNKLPLEGVNTTVEYVIVNKNDLTYFKVLTVVIANFPPTVTSVTVNPSNVSVRKGETETFTASVVGTNDPPDGVTWSVAGATDTIGTTISSSGVLTVSLTETALTLTVKATSTFDTTKSGTATVTVTAALTYSISLSPTGTLTFTTEMTGYTPIPPEVITVTNTGTGATGDLTVGLSGTDASSFSLSTTLINSITTNNGTDTFTVKPNDNLSSTTTTTVGKTYTATVTVSGTNLTSKSFNVSFTVNSAVINIYTINGVTVPVTGGTPVTNITETAQYTGTVSWAPTVTGTFAAGQVYTATITLAAKTGYTLQGVPANSFTTVAGATSVTSNLVNSGVITATFPATAAQGVTLTINFTFTDQANGITPNFTTINRDIFDGNKKVSFTLDNPATGSWDTVTWIIPGIDAAVISSNTVNKVLTISNSGDVFGKILADGYFMVSVIATKVGETKPYSPPPCKITVSP